MLHLGLRSFRKNDDGVTAIEFSLLALPFFLVVFFLLEISLLFMAEVTMNNTVTSIARQIRLGNPDTLTEDDVRKMACPQLKFLFDCAKVRIDLRRYDNFETIDIPPIVTDGSVDTNFAAGESNEIMTLRLAYEWPIFTNIIQAYLSDINSRNHLIVAGTFIKSEPY